MEDQKLDAINKLCVLLNDEILHCCSDCYERIKYIKADDILENPAHALSLGVGPFMDKPEVRADIQALYKKYDAMNVTADVDQYISLYEDLQAFYEKMRQFSPF